MSADLPITDTPRRSRLALRILVVGSAELWPELRQTALSRSYLDRHFAPRAEAGAGLARSLSPDLVIIQGA